MRGQKRGQGGLEQRADAESCPRLTVGPTFPELSRVRRFMAASVRACLHTRSYLAERLALPPEPR
jgi:hypothetical protein